MNCVNFFKHNNTLTNECSFLKPIQKLKKTPKSNFLQCDSTSLPDELIRQVTINCSERGLLLYRVRDQITATLHAYQRLYTSACAYGVRKALTVSPEEYHKDFSLYSKITLVKQCNSDININLWSL